MNITEARVLLAQAAEEISRLRRQNELLAARVEVMDLFACVLHTRPAGQSQGYAEDLVWKIRAALEQTEFPSESTQVKAGRTAMGEPGRVCE
jgi:hypothetical protein